MNGRKVREGGWWQEANAIATNSKMLIIYDGSELKNMCFLLKFQ